jgi:hypothetical protein
MMLRRMLMIAMIGVMALVPATAIAGATPQCGGIDATIVGTAGPDTIRGTDGQDVIVTGFGADVVYGRGERDVICTGHGNDLVYGGDEVDGDYINGQAESDRLYGGYGSDRIIGGTGDDHLQGGGCCAGEGFDVADGGPGIDVCRLFESGTRCERG